MSSLSLTARAVPRFSVIVQVRPAASVDVLTCFSLPLTIPLVSEQSDNQAVTDEGQGVCPLCGGDIDHDSPIVKSTRKRIRFVAAMIPIGVIVAAGGKLLAYLAPAWGPWGHGLVGAGIVIALLSAAYVKSLD